MATKIPIQGELEQIATPESLLGIDALICKSVPEFGREVHVTTDGEAFFSCHQNGIHASARGTYHNERATRFLSARRVGHFTTLYGDVIYVSKAEWDVLTEFGNVRVSVTPVQAAALKTKTASNPMVKIYGDTFSVKDQLKSLGGKWDSNTRLWSVPLSGAAAAISHVEEFTNQGILRPEVASIVALFAIAAQGAPDPAFEDAMKAYDAFLKTGRVRVFNSYPTAAKPKAVSEVRTNKRAGKCHRCKTPLAVGQGALFYSAKIVGGREQGWLIECLPEHSVDCKARESGSYGIPHLESQSALSTVTVSHVIVDDPNISDLFGDDKPKDQTNEAEVNVLLMNILDDSDLPF